VVGLFGANDDIRRFQAHDKAFLIAVRQDAKFPFKAVRYEVKDENLQAGC
jgi:hypothetical protein